MRRQPRYRSLPLAVIVLLIGLLVVSAAGCSGAAPASSPAVDQAAFGSANKAAESPRAPEAAPSESGPAVAPVAPSGGTASSGSAPAAAPAPSTNAASWDRMIIRTANLTIVVRNVEEALTQIRQITDASQGFTAAAQTAYKGDHMTATVTVQVPAQQFDGVVSQVRKLAVKVQTENSSSQDVTEEFTDVQSQIRNLQATEQGLLRLMDRATSVSDIIALQRELTNVRGQIERLQGRANYLQRRADMSTLVISVIPEALAREQQTPTGWDPLRTVRNAWESSLEVLAGLAEVILAIAVFSWWLVPIIALIVWLVRRNRRNRRTPAPAAPGSGTPPQPPTGAS